MHRRKIQVSDPGAWKVLRPWYPMAQALFSEMRAALGSSELHERARRDIDMLVGELKDIQQRQQQDRHDAYVMWKERGLI